MKARQLATILYYKFTPVSDPELLRLWQWELCRNLELMGRILISPHGINGTLGGDRKALRQYMSACMAYEPLGELDVKWDFNAAEVPFPRLSVKARSEIVTFNFPELEVDEHGVVGGGTHLDADGLHELISSVAAANGKAIDEVVGREVLFLDGRNDYEYAVGRFKGALNPKVLNAKEFLPFIESGALDSFKDKPVVTYCTGGIRCEILTPLLKSKGFTNVFQIDGGIIRYLERSHNSQDLWEGSVYTFDGRNTVLGDYSEVVGVCVHCKNATEQFHDCASCEAHVLACPACWEQAGRECHDCRHAAESR
jgi:UPF0176 protein